MKVMVLRKGDEVNCLILRYSCRVSTEECMGEGYIEWAIEKANFVVHIRVVPNFGTWQLTSD